MYKYESKPCLSAVVPINVFDDKKTALRKIVRFAQLKRKDMLGRKLRFVIEGIAGFVRPDGSFIAERTDLTHTLIVNRFVDDVYRAMSRNDRLLLVLTARELHREVRPLPH